MHTQWLTNLTKIYPDIITKRYGAIILLALLLFINLGSFFYDINSKNHLIASALLNQQNHVLLKSLNNNLQNISWDLQQNKIVSVVMLKNITAQLNAIQTTLATLPNQDNLRQLQIAVLQLNKQSLAVNNNNTTRNEHAAHSKNKAKRETLPNHHFARTALPFTVGSIDIWNGEPYATINRQGTPDLMAKGDTRSGWTLVNVSFARNQAIFSNHHQLARITLV